MKIKLPSDVYRVLAVLKAEGVSTIPGIADVLDMDEERAEKIVCALCVCQFAHEQILIDGSSEFVIAQPNGEEVLAQAPIKLTADGYVQVAPPTFKDPVYTQASLF